MQSPQVLPPLESGLRLTGPWTAFLNQLVHLDQVYLILRSDGLSIAKWTRFGVFFQESVRGCRWLSDPVSGLALDPKEIRHIYVVRLSPSGPVSLELEFNGSRFGISIQCDGRHSNFCALDRMKEMFGQEEVSGEFLRRAGAGAWLDDWAQPPRRIAGERRNSLERAVSNRDEFEVTMAAPGMFSKTLLRPSFIDFDGSVARFANPDCETVVMADLASPEVEWRTDFQVRFSKAAPDTFQERIWKSVLQVQAARSRNGKAGSLSPAGTPC